MNLFQKYGIKEVADVVFYSINKVGDEEFYTPVLFLDTLKVSTLDKTAQKVEAKGGKGNKKLITWNFGKEITLKLEDALFSPASMSMIWGGELNAKLADYTSAIVKCNIANKYGLLNYSVKAYPSPALTNNELEIVLAADVKANNRASSFYDEDAPNGAEHRVTFIKKYFDRTGTSANDAKAVDKDIISQILSEIDNINKVGKIETDIYEIECIDRMEKCIVKTKGGLSISTAEQKANLLKYYADDKSSSYTIYYDAKTMLPLLRLNSEGTIDGWNDGVDGTNDKFSIKMGTIYYKWTRTIKKKEFEDDGILGRTFVIDADTFPENYRIVGETYIRNQKTGKDQRYQITIFNANVTSDTSITLQAEGDPTTFSMTIDVLCPKNDVMMELREFDVEDDIVQGGTRIAAQNSKYTYTPTNVEKAEVSIKNDVIM